MTTKAKLLAVTLDCAEPRKLAAFYHEVTGLDIQYSEDEYAAVGDGTTNIYFGRVPGRKPAAWPGEGKQFHLDFRVPDVDKAVGEYVALGATRPDFQPGVTEEGTGWVVLRDPEGHLFCVCPERS
ncbi:VOC family protein [Nonomuraea longispora]|uniref:VOC family protein n=1 Tax=Nonomuraea longispora TaxID=1848320 RepID=A0A4R4NG57_9ACTN|nr:VOC family protein [Nonomuraea longispora]TDC06510.1 VOC family protein [Nonomuraea longispora]